MRNNQPVTEHEIVLNEGQVIVSKTDARGVITFVNQTFVEVSGYSETELLGAPHNILRHPDMPAAAFADLWRTIQAGLPWEGLVKNRAKNGDFYWVRANATPIFEDGKITGYISIRLRPGREQVAAAEALYRAVREGRANHMAIEEGEAVRRGWRRRWDMASSAIAGRLSAVFVALFMIMALIGLAGLSGMRDSNADLRAVHIESAAPMGQLADIIDRMRDNLQQATLLVIDLRDGADQPVVDRRVKTVRDNIAAIDQLWSAFAAAPMGSKERALTEQLAGQMAAFVRDGLTPALELVEASNPLRLESLFNKTLTPAFQAAHATARALMAAQTASAGARYEAAQANYDAHLWLVGLALAGSAAALLGLGGWLLRAIRRPLELLATHFDAIANGDIGYEIPSNRVKEFHRVTAFLRAMRAKLAYANQERVENERHAHAERARALADMASKIEAEASHAVANVASRTETMTHDAENMALVAESVSASAQSVADAAATALRNARAVAAATEQLSGSITEITGQIVQSSEITRTAVEDSRRTESAIQTLSQEVGKIGEIATLISDIASQTNLLALNATIEAARAGEAGKGFAVVAGEVKNLASQTAKSTEEITRQINQIQAATREAVDSVGRIGRSVAGVDQMSAAIAGAMEQQSATTRDINRNVEETAAAAQQVSHLIGDVSREVAGSRAQAVDVCANLREVATGVDELRRALVRVVRTSTKEADRRMKNRFPVDIACEVFIDGAHHNGRMLDISEGGATLRGFDGGRVGGRGRMRIAHENMEFGYEVRASDGNSCHISFIETPPGLQAWLAQLGASRRAALAD